MEECCPPKSCLCVHVICLVSKNHILGYDFFVVAGIIRYAAKVYKLNIITRKTLFDPNFVGFLD